MSRLFAFSFSIILIFATLGQSGAQTPQPHSLHFPTAEEYLTALPGLLAQAQSEDTSKYKVDSWAFQKITANELHANYTDLQLVRFDTLYSATPAVSLNPYDKGVFSDYGWHHLLINAWLRENKVDLSTKRRWQFRAYMLDIMPVDFNGDGQPELIVEVTCQPEDYPIYKELLVMQRDNIAPGKYRIVKLPWTFWYSASCGIHERCGGGAQTFKLEDVNGDGRPEWVVASHSCGYGECGGGLTVLGWRHGEMVDLVKAEWPNKLFWTGSAPPAPPALPPDGTWTFPGSASGEHQIVQRYQFHDNRDCEVTYTTVFTWDKHQDRFVPNDRTVAYADSAPCALRRGQFAMQSGDYLAAASAYQRAIDLLPSSSQTYASEALQYAQIRLVLAYALLGQVNEALALRDKVQAQTPTSMTMGYLLSTLQVYNGDNDKVQLCAALRHAVARFNPYASDKTDFWTFGQTDDVQYRSMAYVGGDFSADSAGCDIANLLKPLIDRLSVTRNVSPSAALNAEGVRIAQSFNADLNHDGTTDWLLWLDAEPDQALLLLSAGNHYRFSMPFIAIPSQKVQLATLKLPASAGATLVRLGFGNPGVWDADN